jgi:hypothetical protein
VQALSMPPSILLALSIGPIGVPMIRDKLPMFGADISVIADYFWSLPVDGRDLCPGDPALRSLEAVSRHTCTSV